MSVENFTTANRNSVMIGSSEGLSTTQNTFRQPSTEKAKDRKKKKQNKTKQNKKRNNTKTGESLDIILMSVISYCVIQ